MPVFCQAKHRTAAQALPNNTLNLPQVLAGVVIMFSRIIPLDEEPTQHPLWLRAQAFGAACTVHMSDAVTHLVTNTQHTLKVPSFPIGLDQCGVLNLSCLVLHAACVLPGAAGHSAATVCDRSGCGRRRSGRGRMGNSSSTMDGAPVLLLERSAPRLKRSCTVWCACTATSCMFVCSYDTSILVFRLKCSCTLWDRAPEADFAVPDDAAAP